MHIIPYLLFNGQAEEAIRFYEAALGSTVTMLSRFNEAPQMPPGANGNDIMHATVNVNGATLMFSDSGGGDSRVTMGNNIQLSLDFTDGESQQKAFDALTVGGTVTMPLEDTFWGARFGMLKDKFGICWMFNWDKPGAQPEGH